MAQSGIGASQDPYKLLLIEIMLHIFAAGFLYLNLPDTLAQNPRYGILVLLCGAIVLRTVGALATTRTSSLTGNFGNPASLFQTAATAVLGLSWATLLPLLDRFDIAVSDTLMLLVPVTSAVACLAVFTGSAFNTRLLLACVLPAFIFPMAWLALDARYDAMLFWGVLLAGLLGLSRAASGLEELIERFVQISRGNTELVKNLAVTRDQAVAARKAAEQAREEIQEEIAEREKAEERIKSSERELTRILDDMTDTYFQVNREGLVQRISPSVVWLLGHDAADTLNKPWKQFFSSADEHAAFLDRFEKSFGTLHNYEARLQHSDGKAVWVTLNAHFRENEQGQPDGFEGIARDTTAARAAKEILFQEKELWRVTLESIADGVITTDIEGKVNFLNPIAEKMTGWSIETASEKPLAEVMRLSAETGEHPVTLPLNDWLEQGQRSSLAHPAVLCSREGDSEATIELSGAPIRDSEEQIIGSVMVFHDVTRLRALAMQLSYQATHDALTGLINRMEFDTRVGQAIHTANKREKHHVLLYIDLDQFKVVNDTCGHPAGDELLIQVSGLLRGALRESDVLARLGGDEFGVLLLGCPLKIAEAIAEKIRQQVEDFRFRREDKEFRIGTSIGVVPISDTSTPLTEVMKAVDSACYVAKEKGRNCVHVYKPDDSEIAQQHGQMQWMQRIQHAIENDEFVLYSQVIEPIDEKHEKHRHAELLLRLVENRGTEHERIIPPAAFLPAAERYHLMPAIDRWVLEHALRILAANGPEVRNLTTCSLNLSGQSLTDLKLCDYIQQMLQETGVDPRRICFEITESAVIANMDIARQFVNGLRKTGCRFALDDFGSGLSTFDYLKQLDVDYVKLDGSLVRDVASSRVSQAMVHAVNYVAHVMGMQSIAEFVESEEIIDVLRKLSVDFAQGYAIGKPHPFDQ